MLPADDGLVCGVCAVARWLEVLVVSATRVATAEVAGLLKTAPEVTGRSPHVCQAPLQLAEPTRATPLLSPIDQWGALPFPPPPLTRTRCPAVPGTSSPATWERTDP